MTKHDLEMEPFPIPTDVQNVEELEPKLVPNSTAGFLD